MLPASSHIARSGGVYRGRGPRAAALVAGYLRQQIVEANIQEGDDLPSEAVLMKQFDVSRPTLREALRVLESEGLLTVRRGSLGGFRVHAPDPRVAAQFAGRVLQHRGATLADIAQVRLMLEPQCAKLVAQHRTKSDLKRLKKCLEAGADQIDSTVHRRAITALSTSSSWNSPATRPSSSCRRCFGHIMHDHASSPDQNESTHDPRIRDIHKQHQQLVEAHRRRRRPTRRTALDPSPPRRQQRVHLAFVRRFHPALATQSLCWWLTNQRRPETKYLAASTHDVKAKSYLRSCRIHGGGILFPWSARPPVLLPTVLARLDKANNLLVRLHLGQMSDDGVKAHT